MCPSDQKAGVPIWVAIPVYNNRNTVRAVAASCRALLDHVVVVDDGSSDADVPSLVAGLDVTVLRHQENRGKGKAILTAARFIQEQGGIHMITIDADGQHDPADIRAFLPHLAVDEPVIVVGVRNFDTENVPWSSRFGRVFANFWLRVEANVTVSDCQSGFRSYPVSYLNRLRFRGSRYDFEAEVLAKAAWAGITIREVDISVLYPRPEERVSSFKPFLDNLRLTHCHAMLILRQMMPWGHRQLAGGGGTDLSILREPRKFVLSLFKEDATPEGLARAAAVGTLFGILPILFFHTAVILYVAIRFRLNKLMAVSIQHLFMPPLMPAICIETGYYLRFGRWFTDISYETVFGQYKDRLLEWFLGSMIIAPLVAVLIGVFIYGVATAINRVRYAHGAKEKC